MLIPALFIQALSFYMLYSTSQRVEGRTDAFIISLQKRARVTKVIAMVLLIASFILFANELGVGVGVFAAFLSLMMIGSLIVLFVPLMIKKS